MLVQLRFAVALLAVAVLPPRLVVPLVPWIRRTHTAYLDDVRIRHPEGWR